MIRPHGLKRTDTMHPAFAMILTQLNLHGLGNRPRIIATPSGIPGKAPELSLSPSVLRRLQNAISHKAHQGPREMARRVRQRIHNHSLACERGDAEYGN